MSDQDLLEKEDAAVLDETAKDFSPQEQAEFGQLANNDPETPDDQVGSGFRRDNNKKKFWTRRKKAGGGIAATVAALSIGASVLLGPSLAVNHLREIILNRVSQVQVDHSRRYRRKHIAKFSDMFSKDGRVGGKVIAEMESQGYRFIYSDSTNPNKVTGLVTPYGDNLIGNGIGDQIDGYMEVRHPFKFARWKTKRTEALYRRYGISRSSIVARSDTAITDPDQEINKRIAQNSLDEPADLKNAADEIPENETAAEKEAREARQAALDEASGTSGVVGEIRDGVLEGEDLDDIASEVGLEGGAETVEQLSTGAGESVLKAANSIASSASAGSRVFSGLKGLLNPTDVLDKVCTIKSRLRMSMTLARSYRALSLMKYASTFVGVGDGVRRGNVDAKLLNSVMKRVTAEDRNGNAIGASPGFAYALKGKFSKTTNDSSKGKYGVDGQLTGTWKGVQDSTSNIPGTSVGQCGVIQNPFVQVGSAVVVTVGKAITCVVTVGAGCAAAQAGETAIRTTAVQGIKTAIQNSIRGIFTRQALKSLALNAAVEIGFEGIMVLTALHIEKSLALPVTGQETGAELGSILVAGGGTANKQRSLQAGMVPATVAEYAVAEREYISHKNEELKTQSLWSRVADLDNPESVGFQMAMSVPMGFSSLVSESTNFVSTNVSSVLSGSFITSALGNVFSEKAHADEEISFDEYRLETGAFEGERLAVDFAGNPQVILRNDIANIDPEENINYLRSTGDIDTTSLEPLSTRFKDHIVNCVDEIDVLSKLEFEGSLNPENDCLAKSDLTVRFKAHLAYLDMVDGIEAEFAPEEILTGNQAPTPTDTTTAPIVGDTANVACAPGTTDVGETDGYSGGQKYRIRLCEIPGFASESQEDPNGLVQINSTASGKWLQLFQQAKTAGITLKAKGSFRTMERQQYFYNCMVTGSCNGGNEAARPGYSNHQIGFAVDVDIVPGSDPSMTTCKANPDRYPVYKALAALGPPLGIDGKVPSECWHWSVGGN